VCVYINLTTPVFIFFVSQAPYQMDTNLDIPRPHTSVDLSPKSRRYWNVPNSLIFYAISLLTEYYFTEIFLLTEYFVLEDSY
jgi:hypothetical protein